MQNLMDAVNQIKTAPKYRRLDIDDATILNLLATNSKKFKSDKEIIKATKADLHNIVAPYLGDPDYIHEMQTMPSAEDMDDNARRIAYCARLLGLHHSTQERLPDYAGFYQHIFNICGKPNTLLDLACGLNPFSFPFMGLSASTCFYAYDIIQPRIDLINQFFSRCGLQQLAQKCDVLVSPPPIEADLALFLKEAHRFEKRTPGCNKAFWQAIKAKTLLVSLPASSMRGHHSLQSYHRQLLINALPDNRELSHASIFNDEMLFFLTLK